MILSIERATASSVTDPEVRSINSAVMCLLLIYPLLLADHVVAAVAMRMSLEDRVDSRPLNLLLL